MAFAKPADFGASSCFSVLKCALPLKAAGSSFCHFAAWRSWSWQPTHLLGPVKVWAELGRGTASQSARPAHRQMLAREPTRDIARQSDRIVGGVSSILSEGGTGVSRPRFVILLT